VARQRIACPATVTLTSDEREKLRTLPVAEFDVPSECCCEQEPGHGGKHHGLGQVVVVETTSQEWWVTFDQTCGREFMITTACDTEDT
jgi:hypothetical protein